MYPFFESTIRPLLDVVHPRTIVEVGTEEGLHTRRLLPYAISHGAHLHVIDPAPAFSAEWYRSQCGGNSTLHLRPSHDVLPLIESPDVVLLDGDHNWYTVVNELRILDRACKRWPLTCVHDIEWPYGRRDMYYEPARVPADSRQPHARSGILPGRSALSGRGVNGQLANATHEGGPRNGVLTAVEDFLGDTERDLSLFIVPGDKGLAIIVGREHLRRRRLTKVLRAVHDPQAGAELSPGYASTVLHGRQR